ncbi:MAG: hypothetical protein WKF43_09055 [Acidimicrobiales bacterium]
MKWSQETPRDLPGRGLFQAGPEVMQPAQDLGVAAQQADDEEQEDRQHQ